MKAILVSICLIGLLSAHTTISERRQWQLKDGNQFNEKSSKSMEADKLAISDNNRMAIGAGNIATVTDKNWNDLTSVNLKTELSSVAWTGNLLALGGAGEQVTLWNTDSLEKIYTTTDSYYNYVNVDALAISKDGQYMGVGNGQYLDIYHPDEVTGLWKMNLTKSQDQFKKVTSLCIDEDSTTMISTSTHSAQIRQMVDGKWNEIAAIPLSGNEEYKSYSDINSEFIVLGQHSTVFVYKTGDFALQANFEVGGNITSISLQKNDYIAVGTTKGVELHNVGGSFNLHQTLEVDSQVVDLAFSNDNLVVAYKSTVKLYSQSSSANIAFFSMTLLAILSFMFA